VSLYRSATQDDWELAAKYADMTHWFAMGLDSLKHKAETIWDQSHMIQSGSYSGSVVLGGERCHRRQDRAGARGVTVVTKS